MQNVSFARLEWKLSKFYQNDIENVPIINVVVKGTCANVRFVVGSQRADLAKQFKNIPNFLQGCDTRLSIIYVCHCLTLIYCYCRLGKNGV